MSEDLECLELAPFDACGLLGDCVGNSTQEQCECLGGWSQSKEMALYFVPEAELDGGIAICNFNREILITFYVFVALSALAALWLQIYHVRTWKQIKRLSPFLVGVGLQALLAVYRLIKFDEALFGKDVFFSFLVGNAVFCDWLSVTIFTNRYFVYVTSRLEFEETTTPTAVFKRLQKTSSYLVIADLILYQPCWIAILTPNQDTFGRAMVRFSFGLLGLRIIYYVYTIRLIFSTFISDMEKLVEPANGRDKNVMVSKKQAAVEDYISKQLLPKTRRFQNVTITFALFYGIVLLLCALWDYAFLFYGYLFPLNFISWGIANFSAINVNVKVKNSTSKLSMKKKISESDL